MLSRWTHAVLSQTVTGGFTQGRTGLTAPLEMITLAAERRRREEDRVELEINVRSLGEKGDGVAGLVAHWAGVGTGGIQAKSQVLFGLSS